MYSFDDEVTSNTLGWSQSQDTVFSALGMFFIMSIVLVFKSAFYSAFDRRCQNL